MKNIPNIPATNSAWIALAPETLRERKIRSGISGSRAVDSRTRKATSRASATAPNPSVRPEAPALVGGGLDDRVDAEHQRAGDQAGAEEVGAAAEADALVLLDQAQGGQRRGDPDRDVDEEDPVPVDRLGQHAADQQADRARRRRRRSRRRRSPSPAPGAPGTSSRSCRGSRRRPSRRRRPGRSGRRSASPGSARRRTATEATVKTARPARKMPRRRDQVAEPAGEQQQAAERDQVRVDDPGEARLEKPRSSWIEGSATFDGAVEDDHQHPMQST